MSAAKLYTPEVLALATSLARWPLAGPMPLSGHARAPTCGSSIELGAECDAAGKVKAIGLRTHACAVGQAAAAIFAEQAIGQDRETVRAALAEIESWLDGGNLPDWPGLAAISAARDFPARHGAITLAWRAALVALDAPR